MRDGLHISDDGAKEWYSQYVLHREDGPAIEGVDGTKYWYINGKLHREDGPAVEYSGGSKFWYINGKLHREDGPAIEYPSGGTKYWYLNDKRHREDGPAVEYADGEKEWWINGTQYSKEQWKQEHEKYKLKKEHNLDPSDIDIMDTLGLFEGLIITFKEFKDFKKNK
jgi:hypothetical protein